MRSAGTILIVDRSSQILQTMVDYYTRELQCPRDQVIYTHHPEANALVLTDTTAFLIAACLDRGGKAYSIWRVPYDLKKAWGHLDVNIIKAFDAQTLSTDPVVKSIPSRVSHLHLARTIIGTAKFIADDCKGDPDAGFVGGTSKIISSLMTIFGVGIGIARMIVILRILHFGLVPQDDGVLLPKIDRHVMRLLLRTGLTTSTDDGSVRKVFQSFDDRRIAIIDNVMWGLGQSKCLPTNPKCSECILVQLCPRIIVDETAAVRRLASAKDTPVCLKGS